MTTSDSFTSLDWIGVGLSALTAVVLLAFPFVVAPAFAGMFAEFGATSALPTITRVGLTPWPGLALGLMVTTTTVTAAVLRGPDTIGLRRGLVVGGFFGGALGLVGLLYAMYAPMFDVAGKIKPD